RLLQFCFLREMRDFCGVAQPTLLLTGYLLRGHGNPEELITRFRDIETRQTGCSKHFSIDFSVPASNRAKPMPITRIPSDSDPTVERSPRRSKRSIESLHRAKAENRPK